MNSNGGGMPQLNAGLISGQQSKANVNTANQQSYLNNVNQVTPFGNLNYDVTGGAYDYEGNWSPRWTATQTLSPEQQGLYNQRVGVQRGALDQAAAGLGQGVTQDAAYNALMARNRQDLDRAWGLQDSNLKNRGIQEGSEAWNRAIQNRDRSIVDSSNQATIGASQLAGQNIQNVGGLFGLGQGQPPSYVNTPQSQIQPTDVTGPALAAYQGQVNAYNQGIGQQNAAMGGLFGLGGSVLGGIAGSYFGPFGSMAGGGLGRWLGGRVNSGWNY